MQRVMIVRISLDQSLENLFRIDESTLLIQKKRVLQALLVFVHSEMHPDRRHRDDQIIRMASAIAKEIGSKSGRHMPPAKPWIQWKSVSYIVLTPLCARQRHTVIIAGKEAGQDVHGERVFRSRRIHRFR